MCDGVMKGITVASGCVSWSMNHMIVLDISPRLYHAICVYRIVSRDSVIICPYWEMFLNSYLLQSPQRLTCERFGNDKVEGERKSAWI